MIARLFNNFMEKFCISIMIILLIPLTLIAIYGDIRERMKGGANDKERKFMESIIVHRRKNVA